MFNTFNAHNRLKTVALDPVRGWLYTFGDGDRTVLVFDLAKGVIIGNMSCSNAHITCAKIDYFQQRMFCASREGMLLFFDISEPQPHMCHSMRMIK